MLNKHQPVRPRHHPETNVILRFRTFPKTNVVRIPKFCTQQSQITQMRLYRAVCNGEVPNVVAIGELYDYLLHDQKDFISKRTMGASVVNAVIYEPRLLQNNLESGARMVYVFREILDLQYGLEWQICTWLRRFLNQNSPQDEKITTPEQMDEELQILATTPPDDYREVYEDGLLRWAGMLDPDWQTLTHNMQEDLPMENLAKTNQPKRELRSAASREQTDRLRRKI